jgi:hypothetical protein
MMTASKSSCHGLGSRKGTVHCLPRVPAVRCCFCPCFFCFFVLLFSSVFFFKFTASLSGFLSQYCTSWVSLREVHLNDDHIHPTNQTLRLPNQHAPQFIILGFNFYIVYEASNVCRPLATASKVTNASGRLRWAGHMMRPTLVTVCA